MGEEGWVLKEKYLAAKARYKTTKEYAEWNAGSNLVKRVSKRVANLGNCPPIKQPLTSTLLPNNKVKMKNPDANEAMISQILKNKFEGLSRASD